MMMFLPILAVLVLANLGLRNQEQGESAGLPAALAYGLLVVVYSFGVVAGLGLQLASLVMKQQPGLMTEMIGGFGDSLFENLPLLAIGLWLPSLLGIILLLPPVRSIVAKIIPISPDSPVDAVSLSFSMLIVINLMVTLGVGLDNLANLMEAGETGDDGAVSILSLWVQQLMMALTALIGVGWLTRKRWSATFERLGLFVPTVRQSVYGVLVGLALVPMVAVIEMISVNWLNVPVDQDVERLTEQLLGGLFKTPWGIVTLGLAAALGEEPLFRGAAQPKFGIVLTAILFALVHSNYGFTVSTVVVFMLGLVLGVIRIRQNTSTAMITHAVYNTILGLIVYFSIPFLQP